MKVALPSDQAQRLTRALRRAATAETGGQLFGEQLAPSNFRITELTVQSRPGSFAQFVVDVIEAARAAAKFFGKTAHDYRRHNYIGEWHSHPSFTIQPSSTDANTMRELVAADDFAGSFAVLMIVRLDGTDLQTGAWVFDRSGQDQPISLKVEP